MLLCFHEYSIDTSILGLDDLELSDNIIIINEWNYLRIKSKSMVNDLKIYDIIGRLLIAQKPNKNEVSIYTDTIRKGTVLIVKVKFESGKELSKKVIKY